MPRPRCTRFNYNYRIGRHPTWAGRSAEDRSLGMREVASSNLARSTLTHIETNILSIQLNRFPRIDLSGIPEVVGSLSSSPEIDFRKKTSVYCWVRILEARKGHSDGRTSRRAEGYGVVKRLGLNFAFGGGRIMRVGHLDGRGIVYRVVSEIDPGGDAVNFAADLITEEGERVLSVHPNVFFHIRSGWGRTSGKVKLEGAHGIKSEFDSAVGVGSLFFTDRRIVFIRRPDPYEIKRVYYTYLDAPVAIADLLRARDILNNLGLEFVEVRFCDIVKIRKRRRCYSVYIMSNQRRFQFPINEGQMNDLIRFIGHLLSSG